ncbi:MAG: TIGR00266 family protein [Chloroflexi bacterium]|nr:TIGR00266 family protein [Chloroflexota bacterium]
MASEPGRPLDLPEPPVALSGRGMTTGLRYKIIGSVLQAAIIELDPGQMIFSESGGMSWMSGNVQMNTNSGGGIGKMFKRAFSGESLFIVDFTVAGGTGLIGFASEMPGKIVPLHLAPGQEIIMQKDSFMCAEKSVQLDIHFRRKLGAGLFGGEGFIMQRATGPGVVFAELDGEVVEYYLQPGQVMKVDTGHVAMYEPSVQFDIEMVRGFKNILFGGEGLFLATLRGPGKVWLQTMPVMNVAKKLAEYMPASGGGGSAGGNIIGSILGGD